MLCHRDVRYSVTQDLNGLWYATIHLQGDGRDFGYFVEMHAHEREADDQAATWIECLAAGETWWLRGAVVALEERGSRILDELLA